MLTRLIAKQTQIGHPYSDYPMPYHSSIPTPISGAGSPSSPGSNPELQTVKHEPSDVDHGSPHSAPRADWQYGNPVAYHSHPHSPGNITRQPHAYALYDGLDTSDDSDIQRHAVTEAAYWPSPAAEAMPYHMDIGGTALGRNDLSMGHSVHSLHHQSQIHQ